MLSKCAANYPLCPRVLALVSKREDRGAVNKELLPFSVLSYPLACKRNKGKQYSLLLCRQDYDCRRTKQKDLGGNRGFISLHG